jgi:hypothetical protein
MKRLALAVIVLVALVAVVAWNTERTPQTPSPVMAGKEQPRKPMPSKAADPRDTMRERPERERTGRPGDK